MSTSTAIANSSSATRAATRRVRRAVPPLLRPPARLLPAPRRRPARSRGVGAGGLRPGAAGHAPLRRRAALLPVDDGHRPAAVHRPPPAHRPGSSPPPRSTSARSRPTTTRCSTRSTTATWRDRGRTPRPPPPRGARASARSAAGRTSRSPSHLDVPVTTVEALLHRARKALRREFLAVTGDSGGRLAGIPLDRCGDGPRRPGPRPVRPRSSTEAGGLGQAIGPAAAGVAAVGLVLVAARRAAPTAAPNTGRAHRGHHRCRVHRRRRAGASGPRRSSCHRRPHHAWRPRTSRHLGGVPPTPPDAQLGGRGRSSKAADSSRSAPSRRTSSSRSYVGPRASPRSRSTPPRQLQRSPRARSGRHHPVKLRVEDRGAGRRRPRRRSAPARRSPACNAQPESPSTASATAASSSTSSSYASLHPPPELSAAGRLRLTGRVRRPGGRRRR